MFVLFLIVVAIIAFVVFAFYQSKSDKPTTVTYSYQSVPETKTKPKISAEVSDALYNEVQQYCQKNSITVSNLIRKSVKAYIDNN